MVHTAPSSTRQHGLSKDFPSIKQQHRLYAKKITQDLKLSPIDLRRPLATLCDNLKIIESHEHQRHATN